MKRGGRRGHADGEAVVPNQGMCYYYTSYIQEVNIILALTCTCTHGHVRSRPHIMLWARTPTHALYAHMHIYNILQTLLYITSLVPRLSPPHAQSRVHISSKIKRIHTCKYCV